MVRLEVVFFENELVINFLYAGKIEVWFCEQKTAIRRLNLYAGPCVKAHAAVLETRSLTSRTSMEKIPSQIAFSASQSEIYPCMFAQRSLTIFASLYKASSMSRVLCHVECRHS
jgi:hypothetical protein